MFKGLAATWLSVFPYVGLKFYFFESMSTFTERYRTNSRNKKVFDFLNGAMAAFLA